MPLSPRNQRTFHRTLFAGWNETIILLKRGDDQKEGTVTSLRVFNCRHSIFTKSGEPLQGDMVSDHRVTWHLPKFELDRVGVNYISPIDRIVDSKGRYWQPESTTEIRVKLGEVHIDVDCLRADPPALNQ